MNEKRHNRAPRPTGQSRNQKIVMWSIFGVAGVMLVIAIILFVRTGASLF